MNILYIQNAYHFSIEIESALASLGHSLTIHPAPPIDEADSPSYLQSLLGAVKQSTPTLMFSCGFSPFISLACGALGLPYISWLIDAYDTNYYSSAIKNEWNYIFTIDSLFCQELKELGVKHTYYLPLAIPTVINTDTITRDPLPYTADISLIGTIISRDNLSCHPLNSSSSLRDSTKGYLEGCIACQYQLHNMPSICSKLPAYVWNDLVTGFPIENLPDLESAAHYYDHKYFNPLITYAEREILLNSFTRENRYQEIHLYNSNTSQDISTEKHCGWADPYLDLPNIAKQSIINLVIAHRSYKSAIPPIAWAIIAYQGFLLCNYQQDFELFSDISPALFRTEHEMLSKAAYYYHHEDERNSIVKALFEEASKMHTYQNRISEMFSYTNI